MRLPTVTELASILVPTAFSSPNNPSAFGLPAGHPYNLTSGLYWTATEDPRNLYRLLRRLQAGSLPENPLSIEFGTYDALTVTIKSGTGEPLPTLFGRQAVGTQRLITCVRGWQQGR